jgi:hypothetical protein
MLFHRANVRRFWGRLAPLSLLAAVGAAGCGSVPVEDVDQVTGSVPEAGALSSSGAISFETFDDDVGARAATETRALIRSRRAYQDFFGHAPPASVDFSRQWVVFYSAGTKSTDGYDASILALMRAGGRLLVVTELVSPGNLCTVTQTVTTPHVLVKLAAQLGMSGVDFRKKDTIDDCQVNPCAAVLCPTGSTCDSTTGACVPGPNAVTCGGLAGTPCPGIGKCVYDPNSSCEDCPGVCQCVQNVLCTTNAKFDSSPSVCACVPSPPVCGPVCDIFCQYGNVLDASGCPTCQCNPPPNPCLAATCPAGSHCEQQDGKCATATCPPVAVCVPDPPAVPCGGIAGIVCPGIGKCVDDPSDSCDPNAGGADCPGICQCFDNILCIRGTVFDASPSVCTCVPAPACPTDKCPGPAPGAPNVICGDGTVGGPACLQNADGSCGWTIVQCAVPVAP